MLFALSLLLLCLHGTKAQLNLQDLINCADCVVQPVLGGGSYSSRAVLNLWTLSYTLLQPSVQFSYQAGNDSVTHSLSQLLFACKKSFAYDFAIQPNRASLTDPTYADIISLPYFFESMAMVYNVPGLLATDPPMNISRGVLNLIYLQQITMWDDPLIKAMNPRATAAGVLTNLSITLIFRGDAAGVTRTLLSALAKIDSSNWTSGEVGYTWPPGKLFNRTATIIARDQFASASYVLTLPGALGFAPISLCEDAGLAKAKMYNKNGKLVDSSDATLLAAVDNLDWSNATASKSPTDQPGDQAYPLVTISWVLFHRTTKDCDTYRAMLRFFQWSLTDSYAQALIDGVPGFIPLSDEARAYTMSVLEDFVCEGETLLADEYVDARLSVLKQIMICVSGIFIMLTLTILATLGYKRHSRITKVAGLAFALCFLVGCLLNYVSVFFWAISPELDVYCQARYAFVMLGYSLILGAMFSKSWEVNKVFSAGESGVANPFQEVPWWQFCRVFFTIVALQGVLLLILMVSDAPFSVSINIDAINFQSIHECHVRRPQVWIGLEAAYFVLLLVWGAYLAYETRDVWLKYNYPNESRSILLSIYNLAFCCIILVPLITTLEVSYETLFFLVSIAILWPTSFALSSVYMPKLAKFLGSSFRGSGGNSKGQSCDNSVARSASVGSGKPLVEVGPEKKLLSGDRPEKIHSKRKSKERSEETEIGRSPSPDSPLRERPIDFMVPGAVTSGDFSPSDHHRGIDRTESADLESSAPNWRGLLQSPSLPDLTESPVAST